MSTGKWRVIELAFEQQREIFRVSSLFPQDEKFSLTSQIRRSSRSVCANLSEAYSKRRYEPHFISKITDADAENAETNTWLIIAMDCGYLSNEMSKLSLDFNVQISKLLYYMKHNPQKFCYIK